MALTMLAKHVFEGAVEVVMENGLGLLECPESGFVAERVLWDRTDIEATVNAMKAKAAIYLNHLGVLTEQLASQGSELERAYANILRGFVADRFWVVHMGDGDGCPVQRGLPFPHMEVPVMHCCHDPPLRTPWLAEKGTEEWRLLIGYVGHASTMLVCALSDLRDVLEKRNVYEVYKKLGHL